MIPLVVREQEMYWRLYLSPHCSIRHGITFDISPVISSSFLSRVVSNVNDDERTQNISLLVSFFLVFHEHIKIIRIDDAIKCGIDFTMARIFPFSLPCCVSFMRVKTTKISVAIISSLTIVKKRWKKDIFISARPRTHLHYTLRIHYATSTSSFSQLFFLLFRTTLSIKFYWEEMEKKNREKKRIDKEILNNDTNWDGEWTFLCVPILYSRWSLMNFLIFLRVNFYSTNIDWMFF